VLHQGVQGIVAPVECLPCMHLHDCWHSIQGTAGGFTAATLGARLSCNHLLMAVLALSLRCSVRGGVHNSRAVDICRQGAHVVCAALPLSDWPLPLFNVYFDVHSIASMLCVTSTAVGQFGHACLHAHVLVSRSCLLLSAKPLAWHVCMLCGGASLKRTLSMLVFVSGA
jgi:hypothetical protein